MSEHLSEQLIDTYRAGRLSPGELLALDDHLAACDACRQRLNSALPQEATFASLRVQLESVAKTDPDHLPSELITAYVDELVDTVDREIVEGHLTYCDRCRSEVQDLRAFRAQLLTCPHKEYAPTVPQLFWRRFLAFQRPSARKLLLPAIGTAAFAALLLFWAVVRTLRQSLRDTSATSSRLQRDNQTLAQENAGLQHQLSQLAQLQNQARAARQQESALRKLAQLEKQRAAELERQLLRQRQNPLAASSGTLAYLDLADGAEPLVRDRAGHIGRLQPLPSAVQAAIKSRNIAFPAMLEQLRGGHSVMMGSSEEASAFEVESPVGTAVLSDRPTFVWKPSPSATAYKVIVATYKAGSSEATPVVESRPVTQPHWAPPTPLPRDQVLIWQVVALQGDRESDTAPGPPAGEARFRIVSARQANDLQQARQTYAHSPLILGVLYAQAGLLPESEQAFTELLKAYPHSELAQQWLNTVRARLHHAP